ncbi:methyltransferase domain-containing protein [Spiribacter sp. C176]|uniref:Methyltransferase domain-containing protein n=1 Tax=Spiribacter salilacus TaxID=2664894 RepID=A0A6N7QRB0_9GAMM|nr:class I SAM-dependent methyltransferase [Spiribacter salilacus]MRH77668.1 methyltransferase domain-containing protein [Spiribacter salilacus]
MTESTGFELFANDYDVWFADNQPLLESEVRLLAHIWPNPHPARVLSVGCGTGLFEAVLKRDFDIEVTDGVEPAEGMAEIAKSRGMEVSISTAENADFGDQTFDMLMFNGSTSYVKAMAPVFKRAHDALKPGGFILVIDVPRESSFGILYCLAAQLGTWDHPLMQGVAPQSPYPMPFVKSANWWTTAERVAALESAGFSIVKTAQTLTTHPVRAGEIAEQPRDGHEAGDYVAILARRAD